MILVCRPKGRGNWAPLYMAVEGKRADPLLVRVGQTFALGGIVFRICSIQP